MDLKYREYLKSPAWQQIRKGLFALRGRVCESCGSKTKLEIHHITYQNIFNEKNDDLKILCHTCHNLVHKIKPKQKKRKKKLSKKQLYKKTLIKLKRRERKIGLTK